MIEPSPLRPRPKRMKFSAAGSSYLDIRGSTGTDVRMDLLFEASDLSVNVDAEDPMTNTCA